LAKVRVYELAKEFGVESKVVMDEIKGMGVFVRSAASTIEAPVVRQLKERFASAPADTIRPDTIRKAIVRGELSQAGRLMEALRGTNRESWAPLQAEIGELLGGLRDAPGGAAVRRIEWLTGLWAATSTSASDSGFQVASAGGTLPQASAVKDGSQSRSAGLQRPGSARPEVLGRELEDGFAGLLATLVDLSDTDRARIRQQASGTQFGHDLEFDVSSRTGAVRCHIECKNISGRITLYDIAPKLLQQLVYWENKELDYFIVIAPRAASGNELSRLVQDCNDGRKLPFQVLLWSADEGVQELIRLAPGLYRSLYGVPAPELAAESAADIARRWRHKLKPTVRIPDSWQRYLKSPDLHQVYGEADFEDVRSDAIALGVLTDSGVLLPDSLHDNVREWLTERPGKTLLLLAEFGDGKSFFGYELGLRLAAEFADDPAHGWAVLRIPLRLLRDDAQPSSLLKRRLDKIGVSPADWAEVSRTHPQLIILDGFDEMSAKLDPGTLATNVEVLARCVEYFSGQGTAKVLISSRTHFFEHLADYEQFLQDLNNPRILRIAPIPLRDRLAHLEAFAAKKGLEAKVAALQKLYDPIGMAAKPLLLQMIKTTLPNLPKGHFSVEALYQRYAEDSLRRKVPDLQPAHRLDEDKLIRNLMLILEELAVRLHLSRSDYVNLRDFDTGRREDIAEILWAMSGAAPAGARGADTPDARSRVGVRSLLKPVAGADSERWPVDFFHRSMREFFVARALARAVATDIGKAEELLARVPLQPEIVEFARLLMCQAGALDVTASPEIFALKLTRLAKSAILPMYRDQYLGGNALTLLLALNGKLPRIDWSGLALDYSDLSGANLDGLCFRGSSLRSVSLDNTSLVGTDLREADLTGVQLEQTTPVIALTFDADTNTAYAAYGDRSIRRWSFGVGGRTSCVTVTELDFRPTALDLSPFGDLLVKGAPNVVVLSALGTEEAWRVVSRFRTNATGENFGVSGNYLILHAEDKSGGPLCRRYDPVTRRTVGMLPGSTDHRVFVLDDEKTLTADKAGLTLWVGARMAARSFSLRGLVSLDCRRLTDDRALVATGHEDGTVSLWKLDSLRSQPELTSLWQRHAHAGSVTDVRLSGMFVLSGGMDRTICLFTLTDNWSAGEPLRLHRTLECAGMKIDGIRGPREKALLQALLDTAPTAQRRAEPPRAPRIPTPAEIFGAPRNRLRPGDTAGGQSS
jgi:hypothetical protein